MKNTNTLNGTQIFVGIVTLAVVAAVVGGLLIAGSPQAERQRQADAQRLSDLQQISNAIDVYWNSNHMLPTSLESVGHDPNVFLQNIRDPETAELYEFRGTGTTSYELCATFRTPSNSGPDKPTIPPAYTFWQHGAGRTCFPLEVHPNPNTQLVPKPAPMIVQ